MMHFLVNAVTLICLISSVQNDELLVDQCYYEEIPNFSLQQVQEPSKTLREFVGDEWLTDRFECFKKCCDDEFQIGTIGRCTAAAYYMGPDNKLVCQLLECEPEEKCLWSSGAPGKFAGFIRSTKTTTTAQTTTTTTEITTEAPLVSNTANNSVAAGNNNSTSHNVIDVSTEGTQYTEEVPQHEGTQETVGVPLTPETPTGKKPSTANQPKWSWEDHSKGSDEKPDTIHIEPVRRGHQVPTKGLVAGIVLAVLLLILLISFLTKQLRGMRKPVHYRPLDEDEYQKLTVGEDT